MTTTLPAPVAKPSGRRRSPPGAASPRDLIRVERYLDLIARGEDKETAARAVILHPEYGIPRFRDNPALLSRTGAVAATLGRLLTRAAPAVAETIRSRMLTHAAEAAPRALEVMREALDPALVPKVDGVSQIGREWAAVRKEQREAAAFVLEAVGIGPKSAAARTQGAQVSVNVSGGAHGGAADGDEERIARKLRTLLIQLGRALGACPAELVAEIRETVRRDCEGLEVPVVSYVAPVPRAAAS